MGVSIHIHPNKGMNLDNIFGRINQILISLLQKKNQDRISGYRIAHSKVVNLS